MMSLVACLLMAVTGYVVFTNKTQGNILNNFSPDDTIINIARFCFGANMSTTSESTSMCLFVFGHAPLV
jgi:sodium-coupled neutral amino acid transporter 11